MLIENRKKTYLQSYNPHISDDKLVPPHTKITTIAELRASYRARTAEKRSHWLRSRANRLQAQWQHAQVIHDLLERLSLVYNVPNLLSPSDVYAVFEASKWMCSFTATWHNAETPLSVYFIKPLDRYGIISFSNVKPRYYAGLLVGEYQIVRNTIEYMPPHIAPIALAMGA